MEKDTGAEIKKAETKFIHKVKKNPWIAATVIIGILFLVTLFFAVKGTSTSVSGTDAGNSLVKYLNLQTGGGVTFVSAKDQGNIYEVEVSYKDQQIPVYITKDGKYFVQGAVAIDETAAVPPVEEQPPIEVPKTDKPKFDLYVFSYCPYGTQFEKALVPVYKLLSKKADINIVAIGAMHGEYEKQESLREICIQKLYGKDKLFSYLEKFLGESAIGSCSGNTACSDPLVEKLYLPLGFDKTTINQCMTKDAPAIYDAQNAQAQSLGISGSPSVVINGAQTQLARSPDAVLKAICSAFTTAPAECSQTVSTDAATPGFGYAAAGSSGSAAPAASCG